MTKKKSVEFNTLIETSKSQRKLSRGCENGGSHLMLGWLLVYVLNTLAASISFLRQRYWRTVWAMNRSSSELKPRLWWNSTSM